jgi:hypothetical protein
LCELWFRSGNLLYIALHRIVLSLPLPNLY